MKLSNQALGAIMMALQKSLLEQSDIVPVIKEFEFQINEKEELIVNNPPCFEIKKEVVIPDNSSENPIATTGSD